MSPGLVLAILAAVVGGGLALGDAGALGAGLAVSALVLSPLVRRMLTVTDRPLRPSHDPRATARFPSYDRVYNAVLLGRTSDRHRDLALRPLLSRLAAADLEDGGPQAVRDRVGEQGWALLDPARPSSSDSGTGGLSLEDLNRLLDRWETT